MTTVGVVIPAHDEADLVGAAVRSVVDACNQVDASCAVVVVDDDSSDETAAAAAAALVGLRGIGTVVTGRFGRASTARRAGVERFRLLVEDPSDTWLLCTDADSVVPITWVESYLAHHRRGEVAAAGIVDLIDDEGGRSIGERWRRDYGATVAVDLTHPHVHGANLGVRLDVYDAVGGFGDLDRIEDIDLWRRVRGAGHVPVADAAIVVSTSARTTGRVDRGFAFALRQLYVDGAVRS